MQHPSPTVKRSWTFHCPQGHSTFYQNIGGWNAHWSSLAKMKREINIKYKIILSRPVHENRTQNLYDWSKERKHRIGVVHCIWTKSQVSLNEYTMYGSRSSKHNIIFPRYVPEASLVVWLCPDTNDFTGIWFFYVMLLRQAGSHKERVPPIMWFLNPSFLSMGVKCKASPDVSPAH